MYIFLTSIAIFLTTTLLGGEEIDSAVQLRRMGEYQLAVNDIDSSLKITQDPTTRAILLREKGLNLYKLDQLPEALEALDASLEVLKGKDLSDEDVRLALYEKSKVLAEMGKHGEAIQTVEKLLRTSVNELQKSRMRTRLGRYYHLSGNHRRAERVLKENLIRQKREAAIEMDPVAYSSYSHECVITLMELISCETALKKYEEALRYADEAEKSLHKIKEVPRTHPEWERLYQLTGNVYMEMAEACYKKSRSS